MKTILEAVATKNEHRSINDVVKNFIRCCNKVKAYNISQTLSKPLYGFLMNARPRTSMECLKAFLSYPGRLNGNVEDYSLSIAKVLEAETVSEAIKLIELEMAGLQKHYAKGEDDIFYKDPPFLHLAEYALRYGTDFFSFIDNVEQAIAAIASISNFSTPDADNETVDEEISHPVHLMTAMRAKGKEYETVVIIDANDGMWPIRLAETEAELEQERRVFYVAITRAKKCLLILSVQQMAGRPVNITPYLSEMGIL